MLELKNVSLMKEGKWILKDIDWNIHKGEHWAMLGLNGAGKTALLHMLCAYYFPTKGDVNVLGHRFGKDPLGDKLRKKVGIVSSSIQQRIYETDSAYQIVLSGAFASIGLYETPTDEMREKAQRLLKEMGSFTYANRSYRTLSQGERQRVLIARALMADPELLILDEPTNGLDFLAREQLLESIESLAQKESSPSIIYVTHHVEEVLPCFDHTLLLKQGQVFTADQTKYVLTNQVLSEFFGIPVEVNWDRTRPSLVKL
ncbi:ABC transporter ATP-binding protein [Aquibacillus koreensis]|uniref:ABC transporter ATP-binding protein n=1 Tax=Aquibacillus koreensis TaxID=279446 RepID=A0A9X3WLX0_9BACI|nr:ABC transporter ATP-binding protein [Aquibacillus koreensis]MCT2536165.1 ABC transporter ATP-binding protein [Aquibacillus koreensis]MDC3422090.1 ABC transporter ATP-binding protein [Aquibacillus koreensis]